jgi:hypothetical protein
MVTVEFAMQSEIGGQLQILSWQVQILAEISPQLTFFLKLMPNAEISPQ